MDSSDREVGGQFERFQPHFLAVRDGEPQESLRLVARLANETVDHGELCALGVALVEVLLDCHYEIILDDFVEEMRANVNLRKACSCAYLRIPDELADRVYALIGSGEDLGREPS